MYFFVFKFLSNVVEISKDIISLYESCSTSCYVNTISISYIVMFIFFHRSHDLILFFSSGCEAVAVTSVLRAPVTA